MSRSFFLPRRATEATAAQLATTGAYGGSGIDPIDGDRGFVRVGAGPREIPSVTLERARAASVASYRSNPMARAIIDTYVAFAVGDSGVNYQCTDPETKAVVDRFWKDPRNNVAARQELAVRSWLLQGETFYEMLVGESTGVCRYSVIDPARVTDVEAYAGNPLWPGTAWVRVSSAESVPLPIVTIDDITHLRGGALQFWPLLKTLETDTRGQPFLMPVVDWLDSYDTVLSNLIDRTALARYLVWDVTVDGDQSAVDKFIADRGTSAPRSGSVEVHNKSVEWEPKFAQTGANDDTVTASAVMTSVAAGAGLAKTWLAEPENANRATSLSMAEPVRRRVGAVQSVWLSNLTELVRYQVDKAVEFGELPVTVTVTDKSSQREVMPSETVTVTGPEIAAADAEMTAQVLVNLSQALDGMRTAGILSTEACQVAAQKAWEDYVGVPYDPALDNPDGSTAADIAAAVDASPGGGGVVQLAATATA